MNVCGSLVCAQIGRCCKRIDCVSVWTQDQSFRDETNGGLPRLDSTGHGAHTPVGSNPSTPGAAPATPLTSYSTSQSRKLGSCAPVKKGDSHCSIFFFIKKQNTSNKHSNKTFKLIYNLFIPYL